MFEVIDTAQGMDIDGILVVAIELGHVDHFFDGWYGIAQQFGVREGTQNGVGMRLVEDRCDRFVEFAVGPFGPFGVEEFLQQGGMCPVRRFGLFAEMLQHGIKIFPFGVNIVFLRRDLHIVPAQFFQPDRTVETDALQALRHLHGKSDMPLLVLFVSKEHGNRGEEVEPETVLFFMRGKMQCRTYPEEKFQRDAERTVLFLLNDLFGQVFDVVHIVKDFPDPVNEVCISETA